MASIRDCCTALLVSTPCKRGVGGCGFPSPTPPLVNEELGPQGSSFAPELGLLPSQPPVLREALLSSEIKKASFSFLW